MSFATHDMLQGERYEETSVRSHMSPSYMHAYTHTPETQFYTASGLPAALDYRCGVGFDDAAPSGPAPTSMSASTVMPFANGAHVTFKMQPAPVGAQAGAAPGMQSMEGMEFSADSQASMSLANQAAIASVDPADAAVSIAANFVHGAQAEAPLKVAVQTQQPKPMQTQKPMQTKASELQSDDIKMLKGKVKDMHEGLLNHTKVLKSMGKQMQKHQDSITQYDAGLKNHKEALVSTQNQIKEMDVGLRHHTEVLSKHAKQHKVASSSMKAQEDALSKYGVDIAEQRKQLSSMHTGLLRQKSCVEDMQSNLQSVQKNVQSQLKQHNTFITRQRKAETEPALVGKGVRADLKVDSKAGKKKVVSAGEMAKQMESLAKSMQALQA